MTGFDELKRAVDTRLGEYFRDGSPAPRLLEAMRYSLLAGGKRIRPLFTLEFCRASCGSADAALDVACGVEMLHTYSLIHDDLPCMDNDDLRRGKPTNHVVFGEMTAVLAGDALQAAAFSAVLSPTLPDAARRAECAALLAEAAAENGICGGQYLDMTGEGKTLSEDDLVLIHGSKTASLIRAACLMGAVAGNANDAQMAAAGEYADCVGLAFQIRDDILDAEGDEQVLGKPIGSDARSGKSTFYSLLGRDECERRIGVLTERARTAVRAVFADSGPLCELAMYLAGRNE